MKINFVNYWRGNSMKAGGAFPVYFIEIYADFHPSFRFISFTFLNFGVSICFKTKPIYEIMDGDKD